MGWLFRKSFRILPGVRLNISRKRTSVSVGPPGIKYNIGSGRDRLTVGVPGTGLYYSKQLGAPSNDSSPQNQSVASAAPRTSGWVFGAVAGIGLAVLGTLLVVATYQSPSQTTPQIANRTNEVFGPPAPKAVTKSVQPPLLLIVGRARVVDGDTISINGIQIRLEGIDAPETDQVCTGPKGEPWQCGKTATQYLSSLVKGQEVSCQKTSEDQYGRTLSICKLPDGTVINARLVRDGYALAFVRYSTRYVNEELEAKRAKRGLWAGTFQAPWDWRAENRNRPTNNANIAAPVGLLSQQPSTQSKANCSIKGNINRNGERIYHVPGSKWYDRTQINERAGERWFCSVAEAEAAGWRASRSRN